MVNNYTSIEYNYFVVASLLRIHLCWICNAEKLYYFMRDRGNGKLIMFYGEGWCLTNISRSHSHSYPHRRTAQWE